MTQNMLFSFQLKLYVSCTIRAEIIHNPMFQPKPKEIQSNSADGPGRNKISPRIPAEQLNSCLAPPSDATKVNKSPL